MTAPQLLRGSVLCARFPYDAEPHRPGATFHFCLFIDHIVVEGLALVAVCYGTSRLDEQLLAAHQGAVFSVASEFVRGDRPHGPVTHFVADHVAVLREEWIKGSFKARLDFIRAEQRQHDKRRQRLFEQFCALEPTMQDAALDALGSYEQTGLLGLPPHKRLR